MDSMRSLNTSLPKARWRAPTPQPDTHQSFRSAALTVTNLYKAALADIDKSRSDGYQDALEDLVGFLDKENLGVGDGEGWRIRQWAMERLDGALPQSTSDSEEETIEEKRARSSSPIMERNPSPEETRSTAPVAEASHRSDSAPPPLPAEAPTTDTDMTPLPPVFHFSSPHSYPANNANESAPFDAPAAARRAFSSPRRSGNRNSSRNLQRSAAQNLFNLGSGAGQKRKAMNDFFNVEGFNDRRDGSGGGSKRGRQS